MINSTKLTKLAKLKNDELMKVFEDIRFKRVIGTLIWLKLIENTNYSQYKGKIFLNDALWAGTYEPRILELIPALFIKKPKSFMPQNNVPNDLLIVVNEIKHNLAKTYFRGISPKKYLYWLSFVGHKKAKPNIIKSYRFNTDDLCLLNKLKNKYKISETALIRKALKLLV